MFLSEDQKRLCEITTSIYRVNICLHDRQGALIYSAQDLKDEYLQVYLESGMYHKLRQAVHGVHPKIVANITTDLWVGFPINLPGCQECFLVIGPAFFYDISEQVLRDIASRASETAHAVKERHRNELPIISYNELVRLVRQFYYVFTKSIFDPAEFGLASLPSEYEGISEITRSQKDSLFDETMVHATYSFEKYMLSCIREGNPAKLVRHLNAGMPGNAGNLSQGDPLRQAKNIFIVSATITTRAAIEGGLSPEIAMSLSDLFIRQMEQMSDGKKVLAFQNDMIMDFTRRVEELNLKKKYSKTVTECCQYIQENVYNNIRVAELAAHVHLSVNYLSARFKEETGESISAYSQKVKAAEAKNLLKYTDMTLLEISEQLNYSSQSFFTTMFKQETGQTPKQYRQNALDVQD
ncbi:MAG: AraC family transcriptional regulator [Clostridiales bacterium]|nr:AraC family transcriptional regulator [Clostridiales bacterium]